jgi:hypothetical protein
MTVVGPDGNLWSSGEPRIDGALISIDLMPLGPAGTYTVNYRVTSAAVRRLVPAGRATRCGRPE